jgi:UDP-N-acetylglucosamine--N-acetylmuramyl-(pentapeptide) pyrophosphoryl-undecaprenol N-acetylglucosamine transferase
MSHNKHKTILFAGGGTAGPVVPLLAIREHLTKNHPEFSFLLVGTNYGPEKELAKHSHLSFTTILPVRYKRFCSICNFFIPVKFLIAFLQSFALLLEVKPIIIVGAGGFVQVPLSLAAFILRIPVLIHQQDIVPSLSNVLVAPFAKKITTAFEKSIKDFARGWTVKSLPKSSKVLWTGNPVRESLSNISKQDAVHKLHLDHNLPTVVVTGGGTGAEGINKIIWTSLPQVKDFQIIHITGKGKGNDIKHDNYHQLEFTDDMASIYACADVIVTRAGLSTLSEISHLKIPAIVVPMPDSHQEENAAWLEANNAAVVLAQKSLTPDVLLTSIHNILSQRDLQTRLTHNLANILPTHGTAKISEEILKLI